jgi:hypothetical protein
VSVSTQISGGTSIATGLPRLVTTIRSPRATRSRRRLRWVFASNVPTVVTALSCKLGPSAETPIHDPELAWLDDHLIQQCPLLGVGVLLQDDVQDQAADRLVDGSDLPGRAPERAERNSVVMRRSVPVKTSPSRIRAAYPSMGSGKTHLVKFKTCCSSVAVHSWAWRTSSPGGSEGVGLALGWCPKHARWRLMDCFVM